MKRLIISGGGTGGHIFPAIAIANRVKLEFPDAEILFIGAEGKMEMKKVPEAGYKIIGLPIRGLQRKLSPQNLSLPFKVLASLKKAKKIIADFKPEVVVGVGGYASAPTLYVASKMKIPTVIQEQNSFPGKTNRFLSKRVSKICVAYHNLEQFFPKEKIILTGNPVRQSVIQKMDKRESINTFELNPNRKVILAVGGSLGARTINECLLNNFQAIQDSGMQLIWQCGSAQFKLMQESLSGKNTNGIVLTKFIDKMEEAYAAADVIVSRAGAIAISELSIIGKPIILVPSPNVAEDHQTKNAMALVNEDAAILIKDSEAREKLISTAV
ncbi:MAG TPA: undecaprenyldiphospho-muramoylpentapeptide beta-N-acetylglucosaminyltransferase, partial [Arachidicoccus soli]|nr:undecaprenyldiphospho-muramoylpentapeptide beta-N-acetylglucosaminyltransferase [Arachidicoccus soli]